MPTLINVFNAALAPLGAKPLASVSDDSSTGALVRALWEFTRDSILRSHEWVCAVKRVALAQLAETPVYEYDYCYQLPTDCIRVIGTEDGYPFAVEGRKLLSNESTCNIRYISRLEDVASIDPTLLDAMIARLSYELAYALQANSSFAQKLEETAVRKFERAVGMNTTESVSRYNGDVAWDLSRNMMS